MRIWRVEEIGVGGERAGDFEDLEEPLLLLASDASNYMSGSVVNVDGGFASNVFMDIDVQHSNIELAVPPFKFPVVFTTGNWDWDIFELILLI